MKLVIKRGSRRRRTGLRWDNVAQGLSTVLSSVYQRCSAGELAWFSRSDYGWVCSQLTSSGATPRKSRP